MPIGGIVNGSSGLIAGGSILHIFGGHMGGISSVLEQMGWLVPFIQAQ